LYAVAVNGRTRSLRRSEASVGGTRSELDQFTVLWQHSEFEA